MGPIGDQRIIPELPSVDAQVSAAKSLSNVTDLGDTADLIGAMEKALKDTTKVATLKELKNFKIESGFKGPQDDESSDFNELQVFSNPPGPPSYCALRYFKVTYEDPTTGNTKELVFSKKLYTSLQVPRDADGQKHWEQQYRAGIAISIYSDVIEHALLKEAGLDGGMDTKLNDQISKLRADGVLRMKLSHGAEDIEVRPGKEMKFKDITHVTLYFRSGKPPLRDEDDKKVDDKPKEARDEAFIDINLNASYKTAGKTDQVGQNYIPRSHALRGTKYRLALDESMPPYLKQVAHAQRVGFVIDQWESTGRQGDFKELVKKEGINMGTLTEVTEGEAESLQKRFNHLLYLANDRTAINPLLHEFGARDKDGKGVTVTGSTISFLPDPQEPKEPGLKEKLAFWREKKPEFQPNPDLSNLIEMDNHLRERETQLNPSEFTELSYILEAYKKALKEMTAVSDQLIEKETVLHHINKRPIAEDQRKRLMVEADEHLKQIEGYITRLKG